MKDLGKQNVLGVLVDAVDYDAAVERIIRAAMVPEPFAGTALAVHGIMTGARDEMQRRRLNGLDLLAPDGQPVRWAQNILHRSHLADRVYGPFLMLKVLERAAEERLPVYFYGAAAETLAELDRRMRGRFSGLMVAGWEEGKYRPERPGEREEVVERLRASGARIVFVGLGVPRQESFVYTLRDAVGVPMLAVGAAFDYHAGKHQFPPPWVQRRGLEWLWRLSAEPRRLWRRYLLLNPQYVTLVAMQASRLWTPVADRTPPQAAPIDL
jgi:exopolysaccharide biosynthesis WecB/TagA/CpsF family protein